jgi:aspartate/methionine/tyrosine aminotransferase
MLGARRICWPRVFQDRFRADVTLLQSVITQKTKLVSLTNLHNPSGVLTDKNSVEKIASVAEDHHASLLVDEIFLDGSFTVQSSSFGPSNVIVTSSPTKIYGIGGLHTGWIIAPNEVAARCQKLKAHITGASSYISEILTSHLLKNSRAGIIERFHKRSKMNLESLRKWLNSHSEWFEWVRPDGGIICFPRFVTQCSSIELCKHLLETQSVLVNPGTLFNQEGFIRISYGCAPSLFQDALDALERGFRELE